MKNSYYESPKSSWLMRLFWKAAGADRYLLERSTYSDQVKYFCLGGIVVATGVLAGLAGGYAIYTIFEPKTLAVDNVRLKGETLKEKIDLTTLIISIIFGTIWGLIIFNIDRFIVTSTGKGDGTEAITKQEIRSAIPRIVMGLIIALTISKPIEIRMFQSEINAKISELQDKEYTERKKVIEDNMQSEIDKEQKKIDKIEEEKNVLRDKLNFYDQRFADETMGLAGARGYGPEAKLMEKEKDKWQRKLDEFEKKNAPIKSKLKKKIEQIEAERTEKYKVAETEVKAMAGLILKIKQVHELAPGISLFITLLFIVIELTPIFFKMMLIKGPYDFMDDNVKELVRAEAGIEIEYDFYKDEEGMERHKVTNHAAELKRKEKIMVLKVQEELNEKIISEWKKKKLGEVDDNLDNFIS